MKVQTLFIIIAHLSSRKKDEPERNVGVLSSKARTQVFFDYSMNSLRSYSISYLVAQPKVETRYNQKNLHAFQPFRAECRHACRIKFLAEYLLKFNHQSSKFKVIYSKQNVHTESTDTTLIYEMMFNFNYRIIFR